MRISSDSPETAALCEMFQQKTRTQIISDLLTSALHELEQNLPEGLGYAAHSPEGERDLRVVAYDQGDEHALSRLSADC